MILISSSVLFAYGCMCTISIHYCMYIYIYPCSVWVIFSDLWCRPNGFLVKCWALSQTSVVLKHSQMVQDYTVINHKSTLIWFQHRCTPPEVPHGTWKKSLYKREILLEKKPSFSDSIRSTLGGYEVYVIGKLIVKPPFSHRISLGFFQPKAWDEICSPEAATCLLYGAIFGAILGEDGVGWGSLGWVAWGVHPGWMSNENWICLRNVDFDDDTWWLMIVIDDDYSKCCGWFVINGC